MIRGGGGGGAMCYFLKNTFARQISGKFWLCKKIEFIIVTHFLNLNSNFNMKYWSIMTSIMK